MTETTGEPLVTVVIPCLSHVDRLERCLRSLSDQTLRDEFEVIVVDSASNPEVQNVTKRFNGVRVVSSPVPVGPGEARNLGASRARGVILAFLDADCEAEPDWLEEALAGIEGGAILVGGPVLSADPARLIAVADNMISFTDQGSGRPDGKAEYFPSCNMAVSRSDFRKVGGFPVFPTLAGEDIFFCDYLRAHRVDGLLFLNRMRIRHAGRHRLGEYCRHQNHFGYCRAIYNIRLRPVHRKLGRYTVMTVPVMIKRFLYLLGRSARWNRRGLLATLVLWPLLLIGLAAWAGGFRRGCREEIVESPRPTREENDA